MPGPYFVHMLAGALAIVVGFTVLFSPKGGSLHRSGGLAFVAAMLVLTFTGTAIAVWKGAIASVLGGLLATYLVSTALITVRPTTVGWNRTLVLAMGAAAAVAIISLACAAQSLDHTAAMVGYLLFASAALLGLRGDVRILRGAVLRGAPRLRRHVWRACMALWIATASFFLGPRRRVEKVLPDVLISPTTLAVPVVLIIIVMLYWLWRLRSRTPLRGITLTEETMT